MSKQQPKRILYVENGIGYGGAIICLRHLVRHLDRSQYYPMVVTGRNNPQYQEIAREALWKHIPDRHIDIVGLRKSFGNIAILDKTPGLRFVADQVIARLDDLCNFLPFFLQLLWTAWRFKAELIHANNEPLCNRAALIIGKVLHIPVVCHVRGDQDGSKLMRWAYSLPDHFVSVSNWVASGMINKLNIPAEKISVIYDGIALEKIDIQADGNKFRQQFNIAADAFVVGLVGLLIPWKGQELFLDAAHKLKGKIPNLKMLIIGGTPDDCIGFENQLKQRVIDENLSDIVVFTGHSSDMDIVYNGLDIVVSASTNPEPLGTMVIECMTIGRPLIGPNHGGAAEMIEDKKTGWLFEARSADSLANQIITIYQNPEHMKQVGLAAREDALKKFDVKHHVEMITNLYKTRFNL